MSTGTLDRHDLYEPEPPSSADRTLASPPVVLALLLVLLGALAGLVFAAPSAPAATSADVGFARDMSAHHAQAVTMSEIVRERTQDPALRTLAADVALTQQAQIGMMTGWLAQWEQPVASPGPRMAWTGTPTTGPMPGMATLEQVDGLRTLPTPEAEVAYLRAMVAHHRGGVEMAGEGAALVQDPQVATLARGIAAAQGAEIGYLETLLAARGQQVAAGDSAVSPTSTSGGVGHDMSATATAPFGLDTRDTALLVAVSLGLAALLWLVVDAWARRAGVRVVRLRPAALVVVAGAWVVGGLHLLLTPEHAEEQTLYGLFFLASAAASFTGGALVLAGLVRVGAWLGLTLSVGLVALYVLFRVVAPPLGDAPESLDAVGLVTVAVEVLTAAAGAVLLRDGHVTEWREALPVGVRPR